MANNNMGLGENNQILPAVPPRDLPDEVESIPGRYMRNLNHSKVFVIPYNNVAIREAHIVECDKEGNILESSPRFVGETLAVASQQAKGAAQPGSTNANADKKKNSQKKEPEKKN